MTTEPKLVAPPSNPETQAYFDASSERRFVIGSCEACRETHFYPRALCPHCFSDRTGLTDASGTGQIYAYSVMRRVPVPYAIAYVRLTEGPVVMTNIVDCDFDALSVGQPVRVTFRETDAGGLLPVFVPAGPANVD
jgi:uncharacterized OB-fold protein